MNVKTMGNWAMARRYAILTVVSALLCAPLIFVVSIALSSDQTTNAMDFTFLPTEWHLENFARVFNSGLPIGRFILNSLVIVIPDCIFMTLSSALVSYGFARLRAPGKNLLFLIVLSTMMIPGQVLMIPQFILFRTLGWVNTLLPLIVPNLFANAYNVFLMRQFITRIPTELDEAAEIDGLGYFGIFRRIILPMMTPVLAAVAVFTFSANWGSFFGPLLYINDEEKMPLALGLQVLSATGSGAQTPPWNMIMVGSLILIIPVLLVYYFSQKYLYESGMMGGSAGIK
ncbi:carbohydrate ABC transporter permease [Bifidobacterium favimelis]|uniref:Carbohydrate ABC transporter permease n=1 Tax=Bifidobacterium favimelis TaxID=3122979 RepID=A0ABU8ZMK3_9BIFI